MEDVRLHIWSPAARSPVAAAAGVLGAVTAAWLKNPAELAAGGIALAVVLSFARP